MKKNAEYIHISCIFIYSYLIFPCENSAGPLRGNHRLSRL